MIINPTIIGSSVCPHCSVEERLYTVLKNGLWGLIILNLNFTAQMTLGLDR